MSIVKGMNRSRYLFYLVLAIFVAANSVYAQSRGFSFPDSAEEESATEEIGTTEEIGATDADQPIEEVSSTTEEQDAVAVEIRPPTGFNLIELGLDIDEVKGVLKADSNFLFRGDPDVSMLARPNEALIETDGSSFVSRAFFQFHERRLYTIIIELDAERMDHFTMYTTFVERYGDPDYLDPNEVVWDFGDIRLSLERPLRIKYVDVPVFEGILASQRQLESLGRVSRDGFLDQF